MKFFVQVLMSIVLTIFTICLCVNIFNIDEKNNLIMYIISLFSFGLWWAISFLLLGVDKKSQVNFVIRKNIDKKTKQKDLINSLLLFLIVFILLILLFIYSRS